MARKFRVKATVAEVSEEVSGVGSKVESIKKEVEETAAVQKKNFEKLNERQKQSLNEIFTKYEQNKVKLTLEFNHKGGFLGAEKTEKFTMDSIIWQTDLLLTPLFMQKIVLSSPTRPRV